MSSKPDTFIHIILILIISFGLAFIIYRYLPDKIEGFESPKRVFPVDTIIIITDNEKPRILEELKDTGVVEDKIHLMRSVKRSWHELGHNLTQEAVMRTIVERGWYKTLVLSESAYLNRSKTWDKTIEQIEEFTKKSGKTDLDSTWDVIMLGGSSTSNPAKTEFENLIRTGDAECSYAYMIRGEYVKRVLERLEVGTQMMIKGHPQQKQYSVDGVFATMRQEDRWFMCKPSLVFKK